MGFKVKAQGILLEPKNVKIDFIAEAGNREQAVKAVKEKIDRYLDQHEIEEFIFEHLNQ